MLIYYLTSITSELFELKLLTKCFHVHVSMMGKCHENSKIFLKTKLG